MYCITIILGASSIYCDHILKVYRSTYTIGEPRFPAAQGASAGGDAAVVDRGVSPAFGGRAPAGRRFADQAYAREELVAELGAAFLCADLGVALTPREDHAAYLASWLDVLRADKRAIFQAASFAARAVDYLHALQAAASGAGQAVA